MLKRLIKMSDGICILPDIRFGDPAQGVDVPLIGPAEESDVELIGGGSEVAMNVISKSEIGVSARVCRVERQNPFISKDSKLGLLSAQIRLCVPFESGDFVARSLRAGDKRRIRQGQCNQGVLQKSPSQLARVDDARALELKD